MKRYFLISIFLVMTLALHAQTVLKGVIVDAQDQEPIPGVVIRIEGTKTTAVSDIDGNYQIEVPGTKAMILFSSVGYDTKKLPFTKENISTFNKVEIHQALNELKDVVVTGIYTRKKDSFTGSSSSFKGSELKSVGVSNVLQSLKVLDPSFKIADNNLMGSNPNTMPDMEIRGKTSVSGLKEEFGTDPNQPLFILDGFETTLQTVMDLNMNRVASVTILKDAASTAIYGSKASNGVVVIETISPVHGKLRVSYKGDFSITMADLSDYNLMNAQEKLEFETLAGVYTDKTYDPFNQVRLDNLRNDRLKEIERGVDTYWLSEPLRTGFTQNHNVTIDGGEEHIRYGIGVSYGNTEGVMKNSARRTLAGNIDLIYRTGKFQFSNKLNINYLHTDEPVVSFSEYAQANPYYRKRNDDGTISKYLYYPTQSIYGETAVANPLWDDHLNNYDRGNQTGFTNNFIAEWFATSDLRARAKFGIGKRGLEEVTRLSPQHSAFDYSEATERGSYDYSHTSTFNYEGDLSVTYGHLFKEVHMLNLVGGFNFSNTERTRNGYSAVGFNEDQFDAPSFAASYTANGKPSYSESTTRAASFYLNAGYAYDNRYLLDANFRADGASMFGLQNRWRSTWAVGLGWNIHKEHFWTNDMFQMLKLRGSVGNPGNQNFSAYQAFSTYTFTTLSNIFGTGVTLNSLGNPNLGWQETINYTIGTDITTWGNRLSLTFDYFWKNTDPLLAVISTPGSMGVSSITMNAGKQKSNGFDMTLKISPIYRPQDRINWTLSFNTSHSTSVYDGIGNSFSSLNESGKSSLVGTTRYYDGGSPTDIWAVRSAGIDPATGKELFIKKDGTYSFTYDSDDEVVVGNTQPKFEGVFGSTLYLKGFSMGCYFRYRTGGQLFNTALFQKVENISTTDIYNNQDKRALYDRWSENNREAQYKGISLVQRTDKSSRFVMDENTLSLESLYLSYEFADNILKHLGMSNLTLQASMNDLFRISSVKAERGIDYPFARTVSFSLSATF